jgi:hypothetical protein
VLKPNGGPADLSRMRRVRGVRSDDRGDIVLGWLTKLVVALGLLGILGFDAISLVQARVQAADHATTAASAAADEYRSTHDVQKAYNVASAIVGGLDTIETKTFRVDADGRVTLRVHHEATTLVVRHIPPIRDWADAVGTGKALPSS